MENHIAEVLMVLLSKFQLAFTALLASLVAMFFHVLDQSMMLIIIAYAFLILHVISGWIIMWKYRTGWDDEKWFKACMKFLWFAVLILSTTSLKEVYHFNLPIGVFVAGLLTVNEFRGFVNNVGRLMGIDVWNAVADYVDWGKLSKGLLRKPKEDVREK